MAEAQPRPPIDVWEFADREHPVYQRAPWETRWGYALEGFRAAGYVPWMVSPRVNTREPLKLVEEGHPSVTARREGTDGPTVQEISLQSAYAEELDDSTIAEIRRLAAQWYETLRALSRGPLTLADLRDMGHPYGYGEKPGGHPREGMRGKKSHPALFGSGWHAKGVRGAVPPLSVVNLQSGDFYEGWSWEVERTPTGILLRFIQAVPYAWYLIHGTYRMQAHGPWKEAADRYLGRVQQIWTQGAREASRRRRALESMGLEAEIT